MGIKNKLILKFTEDRVVLSVFKGSGKSMTLLKNKEFSLSEDSAGGRAAYREQEQGAFRRFVEESQLSGKRARIIISQDGVITRLVQSPRLGRKDLDSFITNNIHEYFTLNLDEYEYDYTVVGEEKGEVNKFNILLVLVPRSKASAITDFVKENGLSIEKMTIYPVCMENLFYSERDKSIAVFDVEKERTNITILEKGNIFLYSRTPSEPEDFQGGYDEVLDSLLYFLNFYASRHFGNRVDRIYVTGRMWNDRRFQQALREAAPVEVIGGITLNGVEVKEAEAEEANLFSDAVGALREIKRLYNKDINFAKAQKAEIKKNENLPVIAAAALLLFITIVWLGGFTVYKNIKLAQYDTTSLKLEKIKLMDTEQQYKDVRAEIDIYEKELKMAKIIESMDKDFAPYIEALRRALPGDTCIKSLYIDRGTATIDFVISGTLNKVDLAEALNNTEIFEKVDIESIKLDDSEKEASFELKIVKPLKGE